MRKLLLLVMLTLLSLLSVQAYDFKVDGIYYEIIPGTTEVRVISRGPGLYSGSVTIPATVVYDGVSYGVTAIGERVFFNCMELESVTIGESIVSIGRESFRGCSGLVSIEIPENVTMIGNGAFRDCSGLVSIEIPENVTFIGDETFSGCSGLWSITIGEKVATVGRDAFSGCQRLALVEWNAKKCQDFDSRIKPFDKNSSVVSIIFGKSVEYIPASLCDGFSRLTSVVFPEGVVVIGEGAFYGCSGLTSVVIPKSITIIGDYAFADCSGLESVTIGGGVDSIGRNAFKDCIGLGMVTIGERVTSIGQDAFSGCSHLVSVQWNAKKCKDFSLEQKPFDNDATLASIIFGDSVEYIPAYLCFRCSNLGRITIPGNVTTIGERAFANCSDLPSLVIGDGVSVIGDYAFYNCINLISVIIPDGVTSIGVGAFWKCGLLRSVVIPKSVTAIGNGAFSGCSSLTSVTVGEGTVTIGRRAFSDCNALTSVIIEEGVISMGGDVFANCSALGTVKWNAKHCRNLANSSPFTGCEKIEVIIFGDSVEYIPAYLCYEFSSLGLLTIPNSVSIIGERSFYECSSLVSVTLPESIDTIGQEAFVGCNALVSVTSLSQTPPVCGENIFAEKYSNNVSSRITLYVPRGCKKVYSSAPEWCKFSIIKGIGTVEVIVLSNDESMGAVTGGGEYASGEQATLAAIPNEGCRFVRWNDDNLENPRKLTVTEDIELMAIFGKEDDGQTSNEAGLMAAKPFAYVQGRSAYLSDGLGEVEVFTATGQRVYRGFERVITLPRPGLYVLRVVGDGRRCKILVF